MYESLPLGEVDSRVGHIAKHEKDKKNADGTDQEQEDSEVNFLLYLSLWKSVPCQNLESGPGHSISTWPMYRVLRLMFCGVPVAWSVFCVHSVCVRKADCVRGAATALQPDMCKPHLLYGKVYRELVNSVSAKYLLRKQYMHIVPGLPLCRMRS